MWAWIALASAVETVLVRFSAERAWRTPPVLVRELVRVQGPALVVRGLVPEVALVSEVLVVSAALVPPPARPVRPPRSAAVPQVRIPREHRRARDSKNRSPRAPQSPPQR